MGKKKTKDVNISIGTIEKSAVTYLQIAKQERRKVIKEHGIDSLKEYLFGSGENPFESITDAYNEKMNLLREKISEVSKTEKNNYLGKKKKGVNFIKKLKIEE